MKTINSILLFFACCLLAAGDVETTSASRVPAGSDLLIQFEDQLDKIELGYAEALVKGDASFEKTLETFSALAVKLQKEVVAADISEFIDVRDQANAIEDAYRCMRKARSAGQLPQIVKPLYTGRKLKGEGKAGPTAWAAVKIDSDKLYAYYEPYAELSGKGHAKTSPLDLVEAVVLLRQEIGWMERSRYWNTVDTNGQTLELDIPSTKLLDEAAPSKSQASSGKIKF